MAREPGIVSMAVDDMRPIPDDFVILVRRGNIFGCFIPRNQGKKGESLEYDWYFRTDGLGRFSPDDPQVQSGHSFAGPYPQVSPVRIKFGPFEIDWSGTMNWGYLYYNSPIFKVQKVTEWSDETPILVREMQQIKSDHLRICTTNVKSIKLLDARDARWIYIALPGEEGVPGNIDLGPSPSKK
jgi:hypothetical protein